MKSIIQKTFLTTILLLIYMFTGAGSAHALLSGSVLPQTIDIGATYNGQDIMIHGNISKDSEILVRITGPSKAEKFKKKGKILGLLWMNLSTIEMENVPSMMLIAPSDYLENWMKKHPDAWERMGLGLESVKDGITLLPKTENKDMIFGELLKLKKKAGLYGIREKAVIYTDNEEVTTYEARIHLPAGLPQGAYRIEIFAVRDGQVLQKNTIPFSAQQVGFPAFLSSLAFNNSLLHGILAVIIAIMAGLIIGYLFKGGQGGAH